MARSTQCPYFDLVPGTPRENIEWRLKLRQAASIDIGLQRDLKQAAFEDVLFFFHAFAWCFEPRSNLKIRPFVCWPHQIPGIKTMDQAIDDAERSDDPVNVVVDKSRGQGATWMYLIVILRRWLRDPMFSAGLVTRNEKLVDSPRDPDTLLWKFAWALMRLPPWMLPEGFDIGKHRSLSEHAVINPENGASVVGYSATGDVARGGRKSLFVLDELAAFARGDDYAALNSTQHVANCRFLVSTFLGDSGAYYDAATQDSDARKVILDWRDNPTQNRKLYVMKSGTIREVDSKKYGGRLTKGEIKHIRKQHSQLARRGYKVEGVTRNVWYNRKCLEPGSTPRGIAQELDRDPKGSVSKVFDTETLTRVKAESGRAPLLEGRLVYDRETAEVQEPRIIESSGGELRLWTRPSMAGGFSGVFVVGADISAGTAGEFGSNSVATVLDKMTGEQVAEWSSNSVPPLQFAYVCVALCRWFNDAELIPEVNYGGTVFCKTVLEAIGYDRIHYRRTEIVGADKVTKKPGFWMTNDDVKLSLFEQMQAAMATGEFTPRSIEMLEECGEYEFKNGKVMHVGSTKTDDEGAKGKAHGDRVIANALAWMGLREGSVWQDEGKTELSEEYVPEGSMAARLQEYDELHGLIGDPWNDTRLDVFDGLEVSLADEWR